MLGECLVTHIEGTVQEIEASSVKRSYDRTVFKARVAYPLVKRVQRIRKKKKKTLNNQTG